MAAVAKTRFTLYQAFGVFCFGLALGFLVAPSFFLSHFSIPYYVGEARGALAQAAGFCFGAGIATVLMWFVPRGIRTCQYHEKGDPKRKGKFCRGPEDCATGDLGGSICRYRQGKIIGRTLFWLGLVAFLVGLVLTIVIFTTDFPDDLPCPCPDGYTCEDKKDGKPGEKVCVVRKTCAFNSECPKDVGFCENKKCRHVKHGRLADYPVSFFLGFGAWYTCDYLFGGE